jgi:hypothetical protein
MARASGGSDARVVMGHDQTVLARLWREKGPPIGAAGRRQFIVFSRFAWRSCRGLLSRPAGGARCSSFGEADARLITIRELDAGRLECMLQRVNRPLLNSSPRSNLATVSVDTLAPRAASGDACRSCLSTICVIFVTLRNFFGTALVKG